MFASFILSVGISSLNVLGPDPQIYEPWLEPAPSAEIIVSPFSALFPSLRDYQLTMPEGQCPRPSFSLFNNSFVVESHCQIFDDNLLVIQLAMLMSFSISSLLIVLRA